MTRPPPTTRADYAWFNAISLRWNDLDMFGHVNNAEFYGYFDTAVVSFLLSTGDFTPQQSGLGMVVAESGCRYLAEVNFGSGIEVGLRVAHLGTSSVRYELGVFANGSDTASADGHFVHVFIDRAVMRPTPIPDRLRSHLASIAQRSS